MKPYYDHGGITIYHGDGREILPSLVVDAIVTDPPFGTNEHGGYGRRQLGLETIENDGDTMARDQVLTIWGAGPAIVFGSPRRPEPPGAWDFRLVWDKQRIGLGAPWRWTHEMIYLRGVWENVPGLSSILRHSAEPNMRDRHHPHEKPIPLMLDLLRGFQSSVVCDPFCGSGSTLRAAKDLNRRAIGIEIDERYCEIAARRLGQEVFSFDE